MTTLLRTILNEIVSLFVDDGLLAAGAVVLVALGALIAGRAAADSPLPGPALFAGLAALLLLSVWRRARK